jgi:hypothetical protein
MTLPCKTYCIFDPGSSSTWKDGVPMLFVFRRTFSLLAITAMTPAMLFAGPKIDVDTADADVGAIVEGQLQSVRHVFRLKNTGDSTLVFQNVRPGCGCTSVSNDPTVLPGKTGTITADVNLTNLLTGDFRKSITVTSNAPTLVLSIKGSYRRIVTVEPEHIRLSSVKGRDTGAIVTIQTDSDKFDVTGVTFSLKTADDVRDWRSQFPLRYRLSAADTATGKQKSRRRYQLKILYSSSEKIDKLGEIIIKTNLPEKPEISITGSLESTAD